MSVWCQRGQSPTCVCMSLSLNHSLIIPYITTITISSRWPDFAKVTHLFFPHTPPRVVLYAMSSQADPEAEKKEEADPANQAEVLHNKIRSLSVFPS